MIMVMKRLKYSIVLALVMSACSIEPTIERPARVVISFEKEFAAAITRSSVFDSGIESIDTGAAIAFYDSETGILDSQCEVQNLTAPASFALPMKRMDIFVLGNVWYFDSDGNRSLPVFPASKADVPGMVYHIGGVTTYYGRTERFDEIAKYGIPVCACLENIDIRNAQELKMSVERLFARITVTVNHSGMSEESGVFRNEKLYFRQANGRIMPFAANGSAALSPSDVLASSDYESPMTDGNSRSYVFYLPENRKGTLLPGNTSPAGKTEEALRAAAGDAAALATYVEFSASIAKSAGGYGGGVTYRFYPGSDNVSNFDILRNKPYNINLSFNVDSVFEPSWKVDVDDDFEDSRLFCITKDAAFTDKLPDSLPVAVRKNRPGKVYVYMNKRGVMGQNDILGKEQDPGHKTSDLSDCAWSGDFSALANLGMTAEYSKTTGQLSFRVTDESKFQTGRNVPVTLTLYPGGKTVAMTLKTVENQEVSMNVDEFYLAMKRTAGARGFQGETLSVRALGDQSQSIFRTDPGASGKCLSTTPLALSGKSVDLFAFGICPTAPAELEFSSDDTFNDDPIKLSVNVYQPEYRTERKNLRLYYDGTAVPIPSILYDRRGAAMDKTVFDEESFNSLLLLEATYTLERGEKYTGFDGSNFYIDYLGTSGQNDDLASQIDVSYLSEPYYECLGAADVKPRSNLYTKSSRYSFLIYHPHFVTPFPQTITTDCFNVFGESELELSAEIAVYGNTSITFAQVVDSRNEKFDVSVEPVDEDVVRVKVLPKENEPLNLPIGKCTLTYFLFNNRVPANTIMGESFSTHCTVYHNVTLYPFAFVPLGQPRMAVKMLPPKVAWLMKNDPSLLHGNPDFQEVCGFSEFYRLVKFSYPVPVGLNMTRSTLLMSELNYVDIEYSGIFPDTYGSNMVFTRESAEEAMRRTWVTDVYFGRGLSRRDQPLTRSQDTGSDHLIVRISNQNLGYVLIE